jgi:putative two-component system response regulator
MNRSPFQHTRDNPFSQSLGLTPFSEVTEADRRQILRIMETAPKEVSIVESGPVVLVVEDNEILKQGLQLLLEADGFSVIAAGDGLQALEQMRVTCPDLILSDISMPKMDGYAIFEAVRANPEWVAIPFIFLTARGNRDEVFEGKKLGVEDYLVKPINRQELISSVRSRLARSQELLLAQLQQAYQASLIMLSNAIELRDQYTRGHVERVMDFSMSIAEEMGWNSIQKSALQFGSILHDIGKIYIRESILRKPGRLTEEEWAEMKQHTVIGAELIKNIPYLAPALPIIRHHHERWDGKGYPDGLAGDAIPLAARIVAVADSLDAITSARVYRKACSLEQAYEEILRGRETRYDPGVIDVFQSAWTGITYHVQK